MLIKQLSSNRHSSNSLDVAKSVCSSASVCSSTVVLVASSDTFWSCLLMISRVHLSLPVATGLITGTTLPLDSELGDSSIWSKGSACSWVTPSFFLIKRRMLMFSLTGRGALTAWTVHLLCLGGFLSHWAALATECAPSYSVSVSSGLHCTSGHCTTFTHLHFGDFAALLSKANYSHSFTHSHHARKSTTQGDSQLISQSAVPPELLPPSCH